MDIISGYGNGDIHNIRHQYVSDDPNFVAIIGDILEHDLGPIPSTTEEFYEDIIDPDDDNFTSIISENTYSDRESAIIIRAIEVLNRAKGKVYLCLSLYQAGTFV